jgi:hypothetical protein
MIQRIRLVCCGSCEFAAAEAEELVEGGGSCCPSSAEAGVGASGIAVAATAVCGVAADEGNVALSCAMPGLRDNRQTAQVITNRIKVAALMKSRSVDTLVLARSINSRSWLFDYENKIKAAAVWLTDLALAQWPVWIIPEIKAPMI